MTLIATVRDPNGTVWMCGDSCSTAGSNQTLFGASKIRKKIGPDGTPWLIGSAGNGRNGQIILENLILPETPIGDTDPLSYLVREFVPALRHTLLEEGAVVHKDGGEKAENTILIGLMGRMFWIDNIWCVTENSCPYLAIGSGSDYAEGLLWLLEKQKSDLSPKKRLRLAAECAMFHCSGIGGRVDIISA